MAHLMAADSLHHILDHNLPADNPGVEAVEYRSAAQAYHVDDMPHGGPNPARSSTPLESPMTPPDFPFSKSPGLSQRGISIPSRSATLRQDTDYDLGYFGIDAQLMTYQPSETNGESAPLASSMLYSPTSGGFPGWPTDANLISGTNMGQPVEFLDPMIDSPLQHLSERSPTATMPANLLDDLFEIYFSKVHPIVPILHRPSFYERYLADAKAILRGRGPSDLPAALLCHCVLALAARFSADPYFQDKNPVNKGNEIGKAAKLLYLECQRALETPSLEYLQGCTLLAFYSYLSGPDSYGWMIIGTCTRLAYDLRIDTLDLADDDHLPALTPSSRRTSLEWRQQEEMRRVWWSIWELDTFASGIARRPHTIDRTNMRVKLPVSDEAWFSGLPIESAVINPDPQRAWCTLRNSPNQDERAWFLLTSYLLLVSADLGRLRDPDPGDIQIIDKAVTCFHMLLPPHFHLDGPSDLLSFNNENFRKCNWIISTKIMLQGCRIFIKFLREENSQRKVIKAANSLIAPLAGFDYQFKTPIKQYLTLSDTILRILQQWPPDYIPYNSPFIGCLILGPAAMHLRVAISRTKASNGGASLLSTDAEMLKLVLGHIGRFWKIGSILLDIAGSIEACEASRIEGTGPLASLVL